MTRIIHGIQIQFGASKHFDLVKDRTSQPTLGGEYGPGWRLISKIHSHKFDVKGYR